MREVDVDEAIDGDGIFLVGDVEEVDAAFMVDVLFAAGKLEGDDHGRPPFT